MSGVCVRGALLTDKLKSSRVDPCESRVSRLLGTLGIVGLIAALLDYFVEYIDMVW